MPTRTVDATCLVESTMSKPLFNNEIHKHVWQERHCHSCFQPDEMARRLHGKVAVCPIWAKAMESGRKPVAWHRNSRATLMADTYKCEAHVDKPASVAVSHKTQMTDADAALFDVEPHDINYVPVDGWPNRETTKGTEHQ
jgi:hypothetical protein